MLGPKDTMALRLTCKDMRAALDAQRTHLWVHAGMMQQYLLLDVRRSRLQLLASGEGWPCSDEQDHAAPAASPLEGRPAGADAEAPSASGAARRSKRKAGAAEAAAGAPPAQPSLTTLPPRKARRKQPVDENAPPAAAPPARSAAVVGAVAASTRGRLKEELRQAKKNVARLEKPSSQQQQLPTSAAPTAAPAAAPGPSTPPPTPAPAAACVSILASLERWPALQRVTACGVLPRPWVPGLVAAGVACGKLDCVRNLIMHKLAWRDEPGAAAGGAASKVAMCRLQFVVECALLGVMQPPEAVRQLRELLLPTVPEAAPAGPVFRRLPPGEDSSSTAARDQEREKLLTVLALRYTFLERYKDAGAVRALLRAPDARAWAVLVQALLQLARGQCAAAAASLLSSPPPRAVSARHAAYLARELLSQDLRRYQALHNELLAFAAPEPGTEDAALAACIAYNASLRSSWLHRWLATTGLEADLQQLALDVRRVMEREAQLPRQQGAEAGPALELSHPCLVEWLLLPCMGLHAFSASARAAVCAQQLMRELPPGLVEVVPLAAAPLWGMAGGGGPAELQAPFPILPGSKPLDMLVELLGGGRPMCGVAAAVGHHGHDGDGEALSDPLPELAAAVVAGQPPAYSLCAEASALLCSAVLRRPHDRNVERGVGGRAEASWVLCLPLAAMTEGVADRLLGPHDAVLVLQALGGSPASLELMLAFGKPRWAACCAALVWRTPVGLGAWRPGPLLVRCVQETVRLARAGDAGDAGAGAHGAAGGAGAASATSRAVHAGCELLVRLGWYNGEANRAFAYGGEDDEDDEEDGFDGSIWRPRVALEHACHAVLVPWLLEPELPLPLEQAARLLQMALTGGAVGGGPAHSIRERIVRLLDACEAAAQEQLQQATCGSAPDGDALRECMLRAAGRLWQVLWTDESRDQLGWRQDVRCTTLKELVRVPADPRQPAPRHAEIILEACVLPPAPQAALDGQPDRTHAAKAAAASAFAAFARESAGELVSAHVQRNFMSLQQQALIDITGEELEWSGEERQRRERAAEDCCAACERRLWERCLRLLRLYARHMAGPLTPNTARLLALLLRHCPDPTPHVVEIAAGTVAGATPGPRTRPDLLHGLLWYCAFFGRQDMGRQAMHTAFSGSGSGTGGGQAASGAASVPASASGSPAGRGTGMHDGTPTLSIPGRLPPAELALRRRCADVWAAALQLLLRRVTLASEQEHADYLQRWHWAHALWALGAEVFGIWPAAFASGVAAPTAGHTPPPHAAGPSARGTPRRLPRPQQENLGQQVLPQPQPQLQPQPQFAESTPPPPSASKGAPLEPLQALPAEAQALLEASLQGIAEQVAALLQGWELQEVSEEQRSRVARVLGSAVRARRPASDRLL